MAHGQAFGHRIFPFENMDVRAADRGGGDAHQRVVGADVGDGFIDQFDAAGFDEHRRFHACNHGSLLGWMEQLSGYSIPQAEGLR